MKNLQLKRVFRSTEHTKKCGPEWNQRCCFSVSMSLWFFFIIIIILWVCFWIVCEPPPALLLPTQKFFWKDMEYGKSCGQLQCTAAGETCLTVVTCEQLITCLLLYQCITMQALRDSFWENGEKKEIKASLTWFAMYGAGKPNPWNFTMTILRKL